MKTICIEFNVPEDSLEFSEAARILSDLSHVFAHRSCCAMNPGVSGAVTDNHGEQIGEWHVSTDGACPGCYQEQVEAGNGDVEGVRFGALCEVHQGR